MAHYYTQEELEAEQQRFKELHASVERCELLLGHANNLIDRIFGPVETENKEEESTPLIKIA